jgi:hypothetical protein
VSTINHLAKFSGTDGVTLADGGAIPAGTVTNTGGSLTANSLVLGAGTNDSKVIAGLTSDGTAGLNVGATGVGGTLTIFGTTSGSNTITAVGNGTALNLSAATLKIGATNGTIQAGGGTLGIVSVSTITVTPGATGTLFAFGPIGFSGGKGQHFVTQAANNDLVGTVSVSASTTASVVFTTNYTAAPVCVLTPQTTGITSWFLSAISVSGFTVTVAPSGTYTFGYHCLGNPN